MKFSKDVKLFIENYKSFIEHDQWEFIYKELKNNDSVPPLAGYEVAQLTTMFNQAGINPLDYLTYIPANYFFNYNLDVYIVPDNIDTIAESAFESSTIRKLICSDSVKSINYFAFLDCGDLEEITLTNNIDHIDERAFAYCNKLSKVYFNGTLSQFMAKNINLNEIIDYSLSKKLALICTNKTLEV